MLHPSKHRPMSPASGFDAGHEACGAPSMSASKARWRAFFRRHTKDPAYASLIMCLKHWKPAQETDPLALLALMAIDFS
jgi:hypothetical protein